MRVCWLLLWWPLMGGASAGSLERLLAVLGAGRAPRHAPPPPRYMLDLYRSVADAATGVPLSPTPHRANVVRCYADRDSRHRSHFFFNVSTDKSDKLLEAEFHVYKMKPRVRDRRKVSALKSQLLELKVYQVLASSKTRKKKRKKLLGSRRISVHSSGWEIFSIKDAAESWIKNSDLNLGIALSVRTLEGDPVPKGLVRFARGRHGDRPPILVLFLDDNRRRSNSSAPYIVGRPRSKRGDGGVEGSCARHDLYIDFERIGWSAWIISPKGYNAHRCQGDCSFPLGQNQRPTNHATVQSIAHELGLGPAVHPPCCVPDRLEAISLLYFDEYGNVVYKQYDDMLAASCGCH